MATMAPQEGLGGTYTFASQPRALPPRKKYRDKPIPQPSMYGNIMYDRRIIRGSTYAQPNIPTAEQANALELQRRQESIHRQMSRRRAKERLRPKTPEAVEGRRHEVVQTDIYLERLSDRVEQADIEIQTDDFLDRPPTPEFIPAKSGIDAATQIQEGELFDFDIEVKPIVEVLVGKTMEQALLEVMEEEELASLRQRQREFEELRQAELIETQRLEEQERRHTVEKETRKRQEREALQLQRETAEKVAAHAFAKSYLSDLVPSVFSQLEETGYFFDPVEREVETMFEPWLLDEAENKLQAVLTARGLIDQLIKDIMGDNEPLIEVERPSPISLSLTSQLKSEPDQEKPDELLSSF